MIKYCLKKWNENNAVLKAYLASVRMDYHYNKLVEWCTKIVLGSDWDYKRITEIDNGDYSGTLLYLIPKDSYQPSEYEYLLTYVNYGSCSGCDTLLRITDYSDDFPTIEQLNNLMALCKDIICNIIKPFNYGWRYDEEFTPCEEDSKNEN